MTMGLMGRCTIYPCCVKDPKLKNGDDGELAD